MRDMLEGNRALWVGSEMGEAIHYRKREDYIWTSNDKDVNNAREGFERAADNLVSSLFTTWNQVFMRNTTIYDLNASEGTAGLV
jgi:hypothetical protein